MNTRLLKSKMVLHGDSIRDLAKLLGIGSEYLGRKLNRRQGTTFNLEEIKIMKERYSLTNDEVCEIFLP